MPISRLCGNLLKQSIDTATEAEVREKYEEQSMKRDVDNSRDHAGRVTLESRTVSEG